MWSSRVCSGCRSVNIWECKLRNNHMENLLECDGKRFACKIEGIEVTGMLTVEDGRVYLCQNEKDGIGCLDRKGYFYGWVVDDGSAQALSSHDVTDFRLHPLTRSEVDSYKDWQVGDKVTDGSASLEVIFRSGKVVICEDSEGHASGPFTCDELYAKGFRLVPEDEEDFDTVEVTLEEIAAWRGVPVDKLKLVKA